MKQARYHKILKRIVEVLFHQSYFIRSRTDSEVIAKEILETIRNLPWYIKGSCFSFLMILECFYPFYSRELKRFSKGTNEDKQKKYLHFWCRSPIYYVGIFFKMIFSIAAMTTVSQPEILNKLDYTGDLEKKLDYDRRRCQNT